MNSILYKKNIKVILLLIFFSINIFSEEPPIMLNVSSDEEKIPIDFRNGIESAVIKNGYLLIDLNRQQEALKAQADSGESDECIDDSCLINTGKMLAAKEVLLVKVTKKAENSYSFNMKVIDLETDILKKTETMFYDGKLSDFKKLFEFAKEFGEKGLSSEEIILGSDLISVEIETKRAGVEIYLSNKFIGKTPFKFTIKKGKYRLKLKKHGRITLNKSVKLFENTKKKFELTPIFYNVKITTSEKGAKVYDADKFLGEIPISLKLDMADKVKVLKIKKLYYKTVTETINIDKNKVVEVKLKKSDLYKVIKDVKPENAEITFEHIASKDIFKFNNEKTYIELPEGGYNMIVKKSGYITKKRKILLNKNETIKLDLIKKKSHFLIPYLIANITYGEDILLWSSGVALKLIKFDVLGLSNIELNTSFNRDNTNSYFYSDIEMQYKLNFLKDKLAFGVIIPFRYVFTDKYASSMGLLPGIIVSYSLFKKDGLFIDVSFNPFVSLSLSGEIDTRVFFKAGLNISWEW